MKRIAPFCLALAWLAIGGPVAANAEGKPGVFDYYALAMSWSPTYCATQGRSRPNEPQCAGNRPYSFIMHGFWPQYHRSWPQFCETGARPWVPNEVIREMLDIMPSKRLIIQQYRKHGVCSGLSPKEYFRVSRKAFETVKIPARYLSPQNYLNLTPEEIETDFLKTNPNLTPEMISIDCKDRRLRELRICFSRDLKPVACGANEEQHKLCSAQKIAMPPVRVGAFQERNNGYEQDDGEEDHDDEQGDHY